MYIGIGLTIDLKKVVDAYIADMENYFVMTFEKYNYACIILFSYFFIVICISFDTSSGVF